MKENLQKLKEWWAGLALREQRAVAIGGIAVVIFTAYQFVWSPLASHAEMLRKQIVTQQKLLAWMHATDKQLRQTNGQSRVSQQLNPVLLLSYLQKQIQQTGLKPALKQLKQAGSDSVEMHFHKVEFDKLIVFLTQAVKEQAVTISQLSVVADVAPGIVNADIHLVL